MAVKLRSQFSDWTTQPPSWVKPRTFGTGANPCFVFEPSSVIDRVRNKAPSSLPAFQQTSSTGLSINGSSLTWAIAPIVGPEVTLLIYAKKVASAGGRSDFFQQIGPASAYTQLTISANSTATGGASSGTLSVFGYSSGFSGNWTKASVIDGNPHLYIVRKDASGNLSVFVDGVLLTPDSSSAVASWYVSTASMIVNVGAANEFGQTAAAWNRWLPDAEAIALSANRYALFEPQEYAVAYATAAASTYTLSAATYAPGSLTATGVTPRVTVTVA
jgi:hypothetical protein